MSINKKRAMFSIVLCTATLVGCVAKNIDFSEQQKRMQRCEQYIERERELCLQGDYVTIEDYKEDYKSYQKSKDAEEKKQQLKVLPKQKPPIKPETESDGSQ